ncbi:unnamed protein product, partial [Nesidiocoris tenuis]
MCRKAKGKGSSRTNRTYCREERSKQSDGGEARVVSPIRSRVGNSRAFVYVDLSPCTCFRVQVSNETQTSK